MMLTWTTDKPTKPGWYWLKWPDDDDTGKNITLTKVRFEFGKLEVYTIGNDEVDPLSEFGDSYQWAGPLEPPV